MNEVARPSGAEGPPAPPKVSLLPAASEMLEASEPEGSGQGTTRAAAAGAPQRRLSHFLHSWLPRTLLEQSEVVMRIVIVCAAIFSIQQYMAHTYNERVKRTMDYIERFESGEIARSYATVVNVLHASEGIAARSIERDRSKDEQAETFAAFVIMLAYDYKHEKGKGISTELDNVIGFFNSLQACVQQSLCQANVSHAFFGENATRFWTNFYPYLEHRRQVDPAYGLPFDQFVQIVSAKRLSQ